VIGRSTQGVKLIDCSEKERVIGAVRVAEKQDDHDYDVIETGVDEAESTSASEESAGDSSSDSEGTSE
jgi:DNA gyrase subunit A